MIKTANGIFIRCNRHVTQHLANMHPSVRGLSYRQNQTTSSSFILHIWQNITAITGLIIINQSLELFTHAEIRTVVCLC